MKFLLFHPLTMYKGPSIVEEADIINNASPILTSGRWKKEISMLLKHKILLLSCLLILYMHDITINIAYYRHDPAPRFKDFGFEWIPELPTRWKTLSMLPFILCFTSVMVLCLISLFRKRPRVYMVLLFFVK